MVNNMRKNILIYIVSFLPLTAFLFLVSYIIRVIVQIGYLPAYHKQDSYSHIHSEIVWYLLITGYLSPFFLIFFIYTLHKKNIKIPRICYMVFLIGVFFLYIYLLLLDPFNMLGWFVD